MSRHERAHAAKMHDGLANALKHAIDMNSNGRLEAKELEEFKRHMAGEAIGLMSVDEHIEAKKNGSLAQIEEFAGQHHDGPEMESRDLAESRQGIARKIAADYLGQLWDAGKIDDKKYVEKMQDSGAAEIEHPMDAGKETDYKELAPKIWQATNGAAPAQEADDGTSAYAAYVARRDGTPAQDDETPAASPGIDPEQQLSPKDIAEFQKRNEARA